MTPLLRFSIVALGMIALPAALRAQSKGLNGLTSTSAGRVASTPFHPGDTVIVAGTVPAVPPETSVTIAAAKAVTPEATGRVDLALLDREITAKLQPLDHCRVDVARRKRISPARIAADTLTLRWTILGKGQVAAMDVVGTTPVDAEVLDCIKREANGWRFTAPAGGDLRLQREFVFRLLTPASTSSPR